MSRTILRFVLIPTGIVAAFFVVIYALVGGMSTPVPPHMRVRSDFNSMRSAIQTYRINAGQYPSTEQGLSALVTRPETNPQPNKWIQVFVKIPPDPWGRDYRYKALPEDDKRGFEIISPGKDGVFGTKDDLSSLDDW